MLANRWIRALAYAVIAAALVVMITGIAGESRMTFLPTRRQIFLSQTGAGTSPGGMTSPGAFSQGETNACGRGCLLPCPNSPAVRRRGLFREGAK